MKRAWAVVLGVWLLGVWLLGGGTVGLAGTDGVSPGAGGGCAADSVLVRLFDRLAASDVGGARALFWAETPAQVEAVENYVLAGVKFFGTSRLEVRVLDVFKAGSFAVCALEQTSPDRPGQRELESGCLVLRDDCWYLLPQPQLPRDRVNGLSAQEAATFDVLLKRFATYKRKYKIYHSANQE